MTPLEQYYENVKSEHEHRMVYERSRADFELEMALLKFKMDLFIAEINAPLEIARLEILHGVSLMRSHSKPWWKFW